MPNPTPCQACLEVTDAEFYVTNRLGVPWPFEQTTVALCVPCFIRAGITMGEALQAAMAEIEAMQEPGVLEQVEATEGPVGVAPRATKSKARKSVAKTSAEFAADNPTEATAPDD